MCRQPERSRATIFETERGTVRQCPGCQGLELRFGNAILGLAADELEIVRTTLVEAELSAGGSLHHNGRPAVVLTLGDSASGWVFDRAETVELHRLIAGASLLLEVAGA